MTTHEELKRNNAAYARGHVAEQSVIARLEALGWQLEASTSHENIHDDVDTWRVMPGQKVRLGISIKSVSERSFAISGSLMFELEVLDRATQEWSPSWYANGKAQAYIFDVAGTLYYISKAKLVTYVTRNGFDRLVQNTERVKAAQAASGHRHEDAKGGLIKLSRLIKAGVAVRIDTGASTKPVSKPKLRETH